MTTLHEAAMMALEALEMSRRFVYADNRPQCDDAIDALRAALAQQDPEFLVTNCTLWGSPPKPHEYWSEFFSAMVETRTLAGVFISDAALAQQAEPVAWIDIEEDGTRHCLRSWSDGTHREHALCAAPPQRKPLTEEKMHRLYRRAGLEAYYPRDGVVQYDYERRIDAFARAIERAHGIGGDDEQA